MALTYVCPELIDPIQPHNVWMVATHAQNSKFATQFPSKGTSPKQFTRKNFNGDEFLCRANTSRVDTRCVESDHCIRFQVMCCTRPCHIIRAGRITSIDFYRREQ